jgi:4-hydroxybenzoate polyprenyltransferase
MYGVNKLPALGNTLFFCLVIASVCIAAGGYIINDYFDINIDRFNKPDKLVVDKVIKRRWAIFWHLALSLIGITLSFYVGWKIHHHLLIGLANSLAVILLWLYSTSFKKKLITGNLTISLLTAWVVLVLYVCEVMAYVKNYPDEDILHAVARIFKIAIIYAGFAFIISLVREIIKDVEDMPGDEKYGCKTMPIMWGIRTSKAIAGTWLIVLMLAILILQFYVAAFLWWLFIGYTLIFIIAPLAVTFKKLLVAKSPDEFHHLSQWLKGIMLTGILSILFFYHYA